MNRWPRPHEKSEETADRVLLVEDTAEYQMIVARTLSGYKVDVAVTAEQAVPWLAIHQYSLILLDMLLPRKSGETFLKEISENPRTADIPVMCLTSKSGINDKIAAFDLGAEDYLVKPFDPRELRARVEARLRRRKRGAPEASRLMFDDLVIDKLSHRIFLQQSGTLNEIPVTPTEFKLLVCLVQKPEQAFTRDQLLVAAWGEDARVLDRVVDVHICSLRKKLGTGAWKIQAVPGVGYRILRLGEGGLPSGF